MIRPSRGPPMYLREHPWAYHHLDIYMDEDLVGLYNEINEKERGGYMSAFQLPDVEKTQERIMRILERRGRPYVGRSYMSLHQRGLNILSGVSPGLSITQTAQVPNLTIQSTPAPQENITSAPAPVPAPLPPQAALPDKHVIQEFDRYGNFLRERPETEKEKDDREYAAWKAEHGAKSKASGYVDRMEKAPSSGVE